MDFRDVVEVLSGTKPGFRSPLYTDPTGNVFSVVDSVTYLVPSTKARAARMAMSKHPMIAKM